SVFSTLSLHDALPICGMSVSDLSKPNVEYQGQRYYFCGKGCLNKFQTHPEDYLAALKAKKSACGCAVKKNLTEKTSACCGTEKQDRKSTRLNSSHVSI